MDKMNSFTIAGRIVSARDRLNGSTYSPISVMVRRDGKNSLFPVFYDGPLPGWAKGRTYVRADGYISVRDDLDDRGNVIRIWRFIATEMEPVESEMMKAYGRRGWFALGGDGYAVARISGPVIAVRRPEAAYSTFVVDTVCKKHEIALDLDYRNTGAFSAKDVMAGDILYTVCEIVRSDKEIKNKAGDVIDEKTFFYLRVRDIAKDKLTAKQIRKDEDRQKARETLKEAAEKGIPVDAPAPEDGEQAAAVQDDLDTAEGPAPDEGYSEPQPGPVSEDDDMPEMAGGTGYDPFAIA